MSYGRHATHSHSLKSLSSNNYVHAAVYGSSQSSYLPKSTLPAFKKPLVPSINKYSSTSSPKPSSLTSSSSAAKKTSFISSTTRDPAKLRTTTTRNHHDDDDDDVRPATRHYSTTSSSSRRRYDTSYKPYTSAYGRSASLASASSVVAKTEDTFARLNLRSNNSTDSSAANEGRAGYSYKTSSSSSALHDRSLTSSRRLTSSDKLSSSSSSSYAKSSTARVNGGTAATNGGGEENGVVGLANIGNTCFMNSIMQCLSNTKQLRDFCLSPRYRDEVNPNSPMRGNLFSGFVEIIRALWKGNQNVVNPKMFKLQVQKFSPRFLGNNQQDSQEFLRFLLEGLHEEINLVHRKSRKAIPDMEGLSAREKARKTWAWYKDKDDSFIFDMFVGQLESALTCMDCHHVSLTYDPFWDLSVPLGKSYHSGDLTIDDCLHIFTKQEILDNDEKPMCERCKTRRRMTKKLSIHKFPPVLVLHLKRFSEGSRFRHKLAHMVQFPLNSLDLTPFASKNHEDSIPPVYDLYAVSNHIGSTYGGHYTAYCKNPASKSWNCFNDASVRSMNGSSACSKEAYVLFYQLRRPIDKSSLLRSLPE